MFPIILCDAQQRLFIRQMFVREFPAFHYGKPDVCSVNGCPLYCHTNTNAIYAQLMCEGHAWPYKGLLLEIRVPMP